GERDEWPPADAPFVLIEGDQYIIEGEDPRIARCQFRLEVARHAFDFLVTPGVVTPGIYSLEGARLLICCNMGALPPEARGNSFAAPMSFTTSEGSGWRLCVLERVRD